MSDIFDITTPAGSDPKAQGDDRIREFKSAMQTSLRGGTTEGLEAIFPGDAPLTAPVFHYRGLKGNTGARPAAGQFGLYINTTLNTIQRDNGTTWDDIATLIPSGTQMLFYQASAPVGWTAVALNDKFLRVVSSGGTGGSTGGSGSTPSSGQSLAHGHTVNSHVHDLANHTHTESAHTHVVPRNVGSSNFHSPSAAGELIMSNVITSYPSGDQRPVNADWTSGSTTPGGTGGPSTNTSGTATPGTDSQLGTLAFQYADVIVCSKD